MWVCLLFCGGAIVACEETGQTTETGDREVTETISDTDPDATEIEQDANEIGDFDEEEDLFPEGDDSLDEDRDIFEELAEEEEESPGEREWSEFWSQYDSKVKRICTSDDFCHFQEMIVAPRRLGRIDAIQRDGDTMWFAELGSNSSLIRYDANRWSLFELPDGLEAEIFDVRHDDTGLKILTATHGGRIGLYTQQGWDVVDVSLGLGSFAWDHTEVHLGLFTGKETDGNWQPYLLDWGEEPQRIETSQTLHPYSLFARDYEILALNEQGTLLKDFIPDIACSQTTERLRLDNEGRILSFAKDAQDGHLQDGITWFREGEYEGCVVFSDLPDDAMWYDFYTADDESLWFSGSTGRVAHFVEDGWKFWRVYDPVDETIPDMTAIHGLGETVFVGTSNGRIFEYNGENWGGRGGLVQTTFSEVTAVNEYDVFLAGGMFAQIRHGHVYILVSDWDVQSLWAVSGRDVWAGCGEGKMYHWDGNIATVHGLDGWPDLPVKASAIHGCGKDYAWAVGKRGAISHWNGSVWSSVASPTGNDLIDVVCMEEDFALAIHAGGGLRWNGRQWAAYSFPFSDVPMKFHPSREGDLFVLTNRSVWKFTSQLVWEKAVQLTEDMKPVDDLWGEQDQGLWLLSRSGTVWSDRSGEWREYRTMSDDSEIRLYAISGIPDELLYLVGTEGTIITHDLAEGSTSR